MLSLLSGLKDRIDTLHRVRQILEQITHNQSLPMISPTFAEMFSGVNKCPFYDNLVSKMVLRREKATYSSHAHTDSRHSRASGS